MVRRFARDKDLTDNQEGKVDPVYLEIVEAQTDRRVREFAAAVRRLEAAEQRHARAVAAEHRARTPKEKRVRAVSVREAWELVAERMRELAVLAAIMTDVPASGAHRGKNHPRHRA